MKPVKDYLQVSTKIMTPDGKSLTVANIFALPHYLVALGIVLAATVIWVIFAIRNKEEDMMMNPILLQKHFSKRFSNKAGAGCQQVL